MKKSAITVRLEPELQQLLDEVSEWSGRSRSEIIRDALRRQLLLMTFETFHQRVMPFAEARGYLTDEDIFTEVQ